MVERILRFPEVRAARGESRATIYNRIRDGLFPRPIPLGPRLVGWRESEVAAINNARIRGASDGEIRALVAKLESDRKRVA